jgi:hypothetical protein
MKFIELTQPSNDKILINPALISALEDRTSSNPYDAQSSVHMMGGNYWHILETINTVKKLINESERITTINYETTRPTTD